jgi:hypothetical protein
MVSDLLEGETLGEVDEPHCPVPVEVYRRVLGRDGKPTGYLKRDHYRKVREVRDDLMKYLRHQGLDPEALDYFSAFTTGGGEHRWPERYRRIVCFAVTGSNEGWYVHVGCLDDENNLETLIMGKTFVGMRHARLVADACADALGV